MTGRSHAITAASRVRTHTHKQTSLYGWLLIVHLPRQPAWSSCESPILIWSTATEFESSRSTLKRNKACTPYALVNRSKLLLRST
jgi:hypothetical protein